MALSRDQSISQYGTERYTGWGEVEAAADARAKGISGGNLSSYAQDYVNSYNQDLNAFNSAVDKYTDEVIAQSQGDYNFAAKWIESNFTQALGNNETERAAFLKKVANSLEAKVGTIAFDEQTNSYRITSDRDLALKRLNEDEMILKRTQQQERQDQASTLNSRGLLSSTRENATGLAGKEVANYEANANDRLLALQRARENVNIGSERSLEDNTTSARRAAQGAVDTQAYQTEQAKRLKEKNEAIARATASANKAANESYLKQHYFG